MKKPAIVLQDTPFSMSVLKLLRSTLHNVPISPNDLIVGSLDYALLMLSGEIVDLEVTDEDIEVITSLINNRVRENLEKAKEEFEKEKERPLASRFFIYMFKQINMRGPELTITQSCKRRFQPHVLQSDPKIFAASFADNSIVTVEINKAEDDIVITLDYNIKGLDVTVSMDGEKFEANYKLNRDIIQEDGLSIKDLTKVAHEEIAKLSEQISLQIELGQ